MNLNPRRLRLSASFVGIIAFLLTGLLFYAAGAFIGWNGDVSTWPPVARLTLAMTSPIWVIIGAAVAALIEDRP